MKHPTDEQSATPVTPVDLEWIDTGLSGYALIQYMVMTKKISCADGAFLLSIREEMARRRERARFRREVLDLVTFGSFRRWAKKIIARARKRS